MTLPTVAATTPAFGFEVESAAVVPFCVVPTVGFRLAVSETAGVDVRSMLLRTQIRIQPSGRRYDETERSRLVDLFGDTSTWGRTVHSLLWTTVTTLVPGFRGATGVDLEVAVNHDFDEAASKYLAALEGGRIPLELLFSGTAFYQADDRLQVVQLPWEHEARFDLPADVWRSALEEHFPNSASLRLRRDTFDRLWRLRSKGGHRSWDEALEQVLPDEPWTAHE